MFRGFNEFGSCSYYFQISNIIKIFCFHKEAISDEEVYL